MLNIVREHPEKTLAAGRHLRMPAVMTFARLM